MLNSVKFINYYNFKHNHPFAFLQASYISVDGEPYTLAVQEFAFVE